MPETVPPPIVIMFYIAGAAILVAGFAMLALRYINWRENMSSRGVRSVPLHSPYTYQETAQTWPNERTNEPPNPGEPASERRTDDRTGAFVLNLDECAAVARMIDHKTTAEKPTKASTIWAGFGLKKGDSVKYKRASLIYDTLFVAPPSLTPIAERATDARFASDIA